MAQVQVAGYDAESVRAQVFGRDGLAEVPARPHPRPWAVPGSRAPHVVLSGIATPAEQRATPREG